MLTLDRLLAEDYAGTDGAAVVSGRLTQSIALRGESIPVRSRFTDTFVKRGAAWKLASSHISRLPGQ